MISKVDWIINITEDNNEANHKIRINCRPSKSNPISPWFSVDFNESNITEDSLKIEFDGIILTGEKVNPFIDNDNNSLKVNFDILNDAIPSINLYERDNFDLICSFITYPIFEKDEYGNKTIHVKFLSRFKAPKTHLEFIFPKTQNFLNKIFIKLLAQMTNENEFLIDNFGFDKPSRIYKDKENDAIKIDYDLKSEITPTFGFKIKELSFRPTLTLSIIATLLASFIIYVGFKLLEFIRGFFNV